TGWDPHYRPEPEPHPTDVVMCNYVLNVIASPYERAAALRRAWELTRRVLILAVGGSHDARQLAGVEHGDGTLTSRGTFHHLFGPAELRSWVKDTIDVVPVPVEPGVAYLFHHGTDRAAYLSRRYGVAVGATATESAEVLQQITQFLKDY